VNVGIGNKRFDIYIYPSVPAVKKLGKKMGKKTDEIVY